MWHLTGAYNLQRVCCCLWHTEAPRNSHSRQKLGSSTCQIVHLLLFSQCRLASRIYLACADQNAPIFFFVLRIFVPLQLSDQSVGIVESCLFRKSQGKAFPLSGESVQSVFRANEQKEPQRIPVTVNHSRPHSGPDSKFQQILQDIVCLFPGPVFGFKIHPWNIFCSHFLSESCLSLYVFYFRL